MLIGRFAAQTIESNIVINDKVDEYFYQKVKMDKTWDNILFTEHAATNSEMDDFTLNRTKPCIKYNYSTSDNVLYVHTYLLFDKESLEMFNLYETDDNGCYIKSAAIKSYKDLVLEAIDEYWSLSVRGDEYDFALNCDFQTKVVIHLNGNRNQKYINVCVGGGDLKKQGYSYMNVQGACLMVKKTKTLSYDYNSSQYKMKMNIATNEQVVDLNSKVVRPLSVSVFKACVAHEFGHCLGIADAYPFFSEMKVKNIIRSYKTDETGVFDNRGVYMNIMNHAYVDGVRVVGNDVEMAIQAQAEAYHGSKNAWQGYVEHEYDDKEKVFTCKQSEVIRKH